MSDHNKDADEGERRGQRIDPDEFYAGQRRKSGDWETVGKFSDEDAEYRIQRRTESDSAETPRDGAEAASDS